MLLPKSRAWTRPQKYLIAAAVIAGVITSSGLIYGYERYYRDPDESYFVGTWYGDYVPNTLYLGPPDIGFQFNPDHTFEAGRWYAAGEFLYLRIRQDTGGDPYDMLEVWHIDSMTPNEVHLTQPGGHAILKRVERTNTDYRSPFTNHRPQITRH